MYKRMVFGLLIALAPSVASAQTAQENYLPSKSQFYFRWDGMQKHRAAYDKTAAGQMMKGDTGKFLDELWVYIQEQLQNVAANEPKVGPLLKDVGKILSTMHNNGVVIGLEVDTITPPVVQAVLVFPKAAGESGALIPLIHKIAEETKVEVKSSKAGKRFVHHLDFQFVKFGWWGQGEDAVLFLGTTDPTAYAEAIDAKKTGLAANPLYKKVVGFKEFPTASRGYFDMAGVIKTAAGIAPQAGPVIDELGLKGIKSVTFVTGYEGIYQRSVVDVDMPGPRKGLLAFSSPKKISMKDLPVLPSDLTSFSAGTLNVSKSYDVLLGMAEGVVRVFDPGKADEIKETVKAFEGVIGIDVNKDLFGSFGDLFVSYSSPSDGILGTGGLLAVQIKDGKKLENAIDKVVKAIPAFPGGEISLKKKSLLGAQLLQLEVSSPQLTSNVATLAIYKNWLLYASYPQPIKGFILRQEGKLPPWKADEALTKVLAKFPSEFSSISVSDPRPTMQTVLAAAPLVMNLVNTLGAVGAQFGGIQGFRPFDLDLIPHAQEATLGLFPNVTISIDDGKRIRADTRASFP
jgi:hypothetical protein